MLRPWVPLIALAVLTALGWELGTGFFAALGGGLLAAALVSEAAFRFGPLVKGIRHASRIRAARSKATKLDWAIIDHSMAAPREKRDCERPETLGICTGLECLVYKTCNFNIKKPLP